MSELPDELLKEILEPAFAIPDALFRNPSGRSPFSTYVNNYKTSSLLLVSKNWCRVGTPLLYHDVILRSKAQARALAAAFKSNPDLARWVRKLRVEGGFGPCMQQILEKCGPNLTDVCLTTVLYSDDSASGIVSCLSLLNPTTLVFLHSPEVRAKVNSNMAKLLAALFTAVPTWDKLRSIDCRYLREEYLHELAKALRTGSKSVEIVLLQAASIITHTHRTFCDIASVQEVILAFDGSSSAWGTYAWGTYAWGTLQKQLEQQPAHVREKLKLKRKLEDDGGRYGCAKPERRRLAAMPADPFFRPLASAPNDVADKIWAQILRYVMHIYASSYGDVSGETKRNLLLVCKAFYNAGLPVVYEEVRLYGQDRIRKFACHLQAFPEHADYVKTLVICEIDDDDDETDEDVESPMELGPILRRLKNLERLKGGWGSLPIHSSELAQLADASQSTLRELVGVEFSGTGAFDLSPLARFTRLHTLRFRSSADFDVQKMPRNASMPALTMLDVTHCGESFIKVARKMRFDNLRKITVDLRGDPSEQRARRLLVEAIGGRVQELELHGIFDARVVSFCPNATLLRLNGYIMTFSTTAGSRTPHRKLAKIICANRAHHDVCTDFFEGLDYSLYPALQEINFTFLSWPATEREIKKSKVVKVAERLLEHGVKITDCKGVPWTPRLKGVTRGTGGRPKKSKT